MYTEENKEEATIQLPKVIYIAGAGRSGSTLLGNVLHQIDGFFHVGELVYLWERGVLGGDWCSCGQRVLDCPFWQGVLADVEKEMGSGVFVIAEKATRLYHRRLRPRHYPILNLLDVPEWYRKLLKVLYIGVAKYGRAQIVVDSSKYPSYGFVLGNRCGFKLFWLHLIRHPLAVVHSWQKKKAYAPFAGAPQMNTKGPTSALVHWLWYNVWVRRYAPAGRYFVVSYEDFVKRPEGVLQSLLDVALSASGVNGDFKSGAFARLKNIICPSLHGNPVIVFRRVHHTIGGNPVRFEHKRQVELLPLELPSVTLRGVDALLLKGAERVWRKLLKGA